MKPVRPFVAGILCAMALLMLLDLQLSGLSRALLELLVFTLLWYAFARWQSRAASAHMIGMPDADPRLGLPLTEDAIAGDGHYPITTGVVLTDLRQRR